MSELFSKENFLVLVLGIVFGVLYYSFYLSPRDEMLYGVMDCMTDLHSKSEYDRCVQQQNVQNIISP
jgi:hypothetical protein